jgi:lysyl-tRNA synthetase class 2
MVMTNAPSIQEVIFFPQMKPEKAAPASDDQAFVALGVRAELIPILHKLGIHSVAQLKESKPGKLLNDMGGMRKKLKLDQVAAVTLPEIEGWLK